jgi:phytoene synthase
MTSGNLIRPSYRFVRRIARRSGSNFYRSFWLLPKDKREAMYAMYAFARVTDDLGDCNAPLALRKQWLAWWRQTVDLNLAGTYPLSQVILADELPEDSPQWRIDLRSRARQVLPALHDTVMRHAIPTRFILEIVEGVIADQQKTRFDTFEQLEHYCYLVASAIGLACLHIWEFDPPLPTTAAVDCGLAFQLTNILRDVTEDAERGRIYLPRQHYEQHGIAEDDLLQLRGDDRFKCLILDEVARAKQLFASGWEVWHALHPDGKPIFSMMWRTYRQILTQIEADPAGILTQRTRLSHGKRIQLAATHFIPFLFSRLPVPPLEMRSKSLSEKGPDSLESS